jgi:hypothetical protein
MEELSIDGILSCEIYRRLGSFFSTPVVETLPRAVLIVRDRFVGSLAST